MKEKFCKVFAIVVLLSFLGTSMVGTVSAEEDPYLSIEAEEGSTTEFGGGDYVFIKFSKDAAFGVLYGTEDNPNSIVLVAMHVRYLGAADVYDENGAKMGRTVPIPVFTTFAMKLEDVFEFNDTNDDDICNYRRWSYGLEYRDYFMHEPIYKSVDLETSWNRSEITTEVDDDAKSKKWSFDLTAENLPYNAVGDSDTIDDDVENEVLDKVEFSFHLNAKLVEYNNISVPMYKVEVQKNDGYGYEVVDSERIENREFSGTHGNYDLKYDHLIEGWDFDETNSDPHLLLEWHALIGNAIPAKVKSWIRSQFTEGIDEGDDLKVETEEGVETYSDDETAPEKEPYLKEPRKAKKPFLEDPRKVKTNHIRSQANWSKVGRLTWVSDVEVDGEDEKMYAQVQGAKPLSFTGERGSYYGFAILAGFSYPGGDKIFHDPGMSNGMPIEVDFSNGLGESLVRGLIFIAGVTVLVGLVAAAGVAYTIKKGRSKKGYYNGSYDVEYKESRRDDWDRYYRQR